MIANEFTKVIFGKNVKFLVYQRKIKEILESELSIYLDTKESHDLIIHVSSSPVQLSNVSENDVITHLNSKLANIQFVGNGLDIAEIVFEIKKPINKLHAFIQRMMSLGYNDRVERVGLILHEQVLVPYAIFFAGLSPIHGSAMSINDKVVIFGGKGGVGKTTLELEFCLDGEARFLSDDMVILDFENYIYPNLNFPKIYAYNTKGRDSLLKSLRSGATLIDKIHWNFRALYNSSKVRRRQNPKKMYGRLETNKRKLDYYYMLRRAEIDDFVINKLSKDEAVNRTMNILGEEFNNLFNDLKSNDLVNRDNILNKWQSTLVFIVGNVNCYEVLIPKNMSHHNFRKLVPRFIEQHINNHQ
jgi:hypothetical protein